MELLSGFTVYRTFQKKYFKKVFPVFFLEFSFLFNSSTAVREYIGISKIHAKYHV